MKSRHVDRLNINKLQNGRIVYYVDKYSNLLNTVLKASEMNKRKKKYNKILILKGSLQTYQNIPLYI